jgi:hypothetical protein
MELSFFGSLCISRVLCGSGECLGIFSLLLVQEVVLVYLPCCSANKDTKILEFLGKVEYILKANLDSIPSPSPSVKIQIM